MRITSVILIACTLSTIMGCKISLDPVADKSGFGVDIKTRVDLKELLSSKKQQRKVQK